MLTTRNGRDIRDPSLEDLTSVLADVLLNPEGTDPEHPNAWFRVGVATGHVYMLDFYETREMWYSVYADEDDPGPELCVGPKECTWGEAIQLCAYLDYGSIDRVKAWFGVGAV
jgi:hypothetical protein